jgi:hypothetical protein
MGCGVPVRPCGDSSAQLSSHGCYRQSTRCISSSTPGRQIPRNCRQIKVVFSYLFSQKKLDFIPLFCKNKTKHYVKFLAKRYSFFILDFSLKRPKKSQKALTHPIKNLVFWMELNTPIKILAFYISSF